MGQESTSLSIGFSLGNLNNNLVLESIAPEVSGVSKVVAYSTNRDVSWAATNNAIVVGHSTYTKQMTEVLTFNNARRAQTTVPAASVVISKIGKYFNAAGEETPVSFTFDSSRSEVVASKSVTGAVSVSYSATGDVAHVAHHIVNGVYEDTEVVATSPTSGVSTIKVSFQVQSATEHPPSQAKIVVVEPPAWVPNVSGTPAARATVAVCGPSPTVTVSAGNVSSISSGDTSITEVLLFNNTPYASLSAVPSSLSGFPVSGKFSSLENSLGGVVSLPRLAQPTEIVTEGKWVNADTSTATGSVVLSDNEIAALTTGRLALPVIGAVEVTYTTTVSYYYVDFDMANRGRGHIVSLTASTGDKFGAITLTAPT